MREGVINELLPVSSGKSPVACMNDIRAQFGEVAAHIGYTGAHGLEQVLEDLASVIAEVIAARGTRLGLTQRIDAAINQDGSLKATIAAGNISEWVDPAYASVTRVDASNFSFAGNGTDIYRAYRRVRITDGANSFYGLVRGSSMANNVTTVELYDAVVPVGPANVFYSLITPGPSNVASLDSRIIGVFGAQFYNQCGF